MSIHGAAHVVLDVAGHDVESEILIAPDLDGLILGIDWLRSQGRVRWDFDSGKIKFGRRKWMELQRETEQPCRTSLIRKDFPMANHRIGSDRSDFHAAPTGPVRRFCSSRFHRKILYEVSLFCRAIHQVENGRERGKSSGQGAIQGVSGVRRRIHDDVFATLSQYPPCPPNFWASYMIVRSARRTLWTLLHFRPGSSGTASAEEDTETRKDPAELGHSQKSQNNEGKTPGMSSAIEIVSPRRNGVFRRELDPHTPASPVKDLATRIADEARPIEVVNSAQNRDSGQLRDNLARSARTLGEVLFEGVESVDERMNPSSVLGVAAESTDGPMTPPPHLQLRCSQLDLSLESTDGKMTPTSAELMETAEITNSFWEASPPFSGVLDTVEGHLRQTTANTEEELL